jgi:pimeloyl-ACP methyl ester carboxylesterase
VIGIYCDKITEKVGSSLNTNYISIKLLPATLPTAYFNFEKTLLAYLKIGEGENVLLFFHGYGQNHQVFKNKANALYGSHTCYLFDLFFHGESEWGYGEEVLTKKFWNELIKAFLAEQKINRFSVVGFSLGGRFVFATLEALSDKIDNMYLLAPDGVKTSFWYSLATYPVVFRKLFKRMIFHEGLFYSIAHFINRFGLVDKGLLRFAESQMKTKEMRKRVYYSWVVFRKLQFDMRSIGEIIHQNNIRSSMTLGKFDKVITVNNMNRLLQHLANCELKLVDTGHNGIIGKWEL